MGRGKGKGALGAGGMWAGGSAWLRSQAGLWPTALPQGCQADPPACVPGLWAALCVQGPNSEAWPQGALLPGVGPPGADASRLPVTWGDAPSGIMGLRGARIQEPKTSEEIGESPWPCLLGVASGKPARLALPSAADRVGGAPGTHPPSLPA